MNHENELLEKFQVEELEKRYEFQWIETAKIGASYENIEVHVVVELN